MDETHPYINDIVETEPRAFPDGTVQTVKWYQFKVPIESYDHRVGNIRDFRSIRFIRMFLNDFEKDVNMRFARLELVRNQWRRYRFSLLNPGEYIPVDDDDETQFNVSSVSVEENSDREPVPYVLPPGITREENLGGASANSTFLQNEQALTMEVCPLKDGDARAIFKTLRIDLRQFKRMRLEVHAEPLIGAPAGFEALSDGDLRIFIRMGNDFTENYYEYELPLNITDPDDPRLNTGNLDDIDLREAVWATPIDFPLDSFIQVKKERNFSDASLISPYTIAFGDGTISVIGNPNLGFVENIMIGVRNPKETVGTGPSYCAEIWVNELRLSSINEEGGIAALARLDMKLADLGNFTLSGNMHTIGFGTLEQQIQDRYRDNFYQYDAALSLELGKFFPEKIGLRLPMYASVSQSFSTPEFDPYDFDIDLNEKLDAIRLFYGADSARNYKQTVQDITTVTSINFTNIRIERDRAGKKPKPWDIENFNFTYAFTRSNNQSPILEYDRITRHKGALAYTYSNKPTYISPFEKMIDRKRKYLALIRDINFNPIPNGFNFRTDITRQFGETLMRDLYGDAFIAPTYDKFFTWDRFYGLQWDITKSIKFDYSATNLARIDEPFGAIDTKEKRDSMWTNFWKFGRNVDFRQSMSANYNLPFKKIPILNWVSVKAGYNADYTWRAGTRGLADTLGNVITNSQNRNLNGELNFRNLYNKSKFLKRYNSSSRNTGNEPGIFGNAGKEEEEAAKAFEEFDRKQEEGDFGDDEGDSKDDEKDKDKSKDKKGGVKVANGVADVFIRILLGVKRVSINFTQDFQHHHTRIHANPRVHRAEHRQPGSRYWFRGRAATQSAMVI